MENESKIERILFCGVLIAVGFWIFSIIWTFFEMSVVLYEDGSWVLSGCLKGMGC